MNWKAIKQIYYRVLVCKDKIEYLGENRYKLIHYYLTGEKFWEAEYQNEQLHGKYVGWNKDGQKNWEYKYKNGKKI